MHPSPDDPLDPAYFDSSMVRALLAGYGPRASAINDGGQIAPRPGPVARLIGAVQTGWSRLLALPARLSGVPAATLRHATGRRRPGQRSSAAPFRVSVP